MRRAQMVVLALALSAGGAAVMLMSRVERSSPPPPAEPQIATVEILVAKTDIDAGSKVTPERVQWHAWPAAAVSPEYFPKAENQSAVVTEVAASVARTAFSPGEPILRTKLILANGSGYMAALIRRGMRAVSTDITTESGVAGFILPNDRVDVILTRADKSNKSDGGKTETSSETILANVRVLAIDQTAEEKNGQRVVIGKVATLEVSSTQAETLTLGRRLGTLSLVLRSYRDNSGEAGELADVLNGPEGIAVIRGPNGDVELLRLAKGRRPVQAPLGIQ